MPLQDLPPHPNTPPEADWRRSRLVVLSLVLVGSCLY